VTQDDRLQLEANKALLRNYLEEFWNKGDYAVAERSVAPDAFFHDFADAPEPLPQGLAGVKEVFRRFRLGAPDFRMIIDDMVAEGDKVVARFAVKGEQTGVFQGIPPTYRSFDFTGIAIARIENGKIAEGWQNMDVLKAMQQLGVVPSGPLPAPIRWAIALRGKMHARKRRRR
jgi:steroid delta-isomerase-like uncharacterized protein